MQIHFDHRAFPSALRGMVAVLGNFDGVHRGHQAVIAQGKAAAIALGKPLLLVTFEPHPRRFFAPGAPPFRLCAPAAQARLMAALGVDHLLVISFDAAFASLSPDAFIDDILVDALGVSHVIVGHDFRFGKNRAGDCAYLAARAHALDIGFQVVDPIGHEGIVFSSTLIRDLVAQGHVEEAADKLGHWWEIEGLVKPGDARGRTLGFATANLDLDDYQRPRRGVYGLWIKIEGEARWRLSVANYGFRPTFNGQDERLEIHILDDAVPDLYGCRLRAAFLHFIRPEQSFSSADALVTQIAQDVAQARALGLNPHYAPKRFPLFSAADAASTEPWQPA